MKGLVRVAAVVPEVHIGNVDANVDISGESLEINNVSETETPK